MRTPPFAARVTNGDNQRERAAHLFRRQHIHIHRRKHLGYASELTAIFQEIESNSQLVVTSELTLAECLIGARKARSRELEAMYEDILAPSEMIAPIPVSRDILRAAAGYAGDTNVKLADAIHVVTAIALDCEVFLTNDRRVITPKQICLMQLADVKRG